MQLFSLLLKTIMRATTHRIDLMAPVGSFESLMAAIQAGAASVYFGVGKLNMRSRSAVNFGPNDIAEITAICKNHNVRTYLTVNTVIYDDETAEMQQLLQLALKHQISAVIASDVAVMEYARGLGLEVHASTQLNISNSQAVKYFSRWCDVMVLARELSLEQVAAINQSIIKHNICGPSGKPVRTELFIHGALCMAISGKCYLSLHEYNASANRGACYQTCRRSYLVTDNETGYQLEIDNQYIMSPKDLKTIHFLNKILDAGVSVLKIEGRARSPEYVKTVTRCYKDAIEAWSNNEFTEEKLNNWEQQLVRVFNRGFWNGYYLGQRLGEWSMHYGSAATQSKVFLAVCRNYFPNQGVAEFVLETNETLKKGESVVVIGKTTGVVEFIAEEMRVDNIAVDELRQGDCFSIKTPEVLRRNDKLYKYSSRAK